MADFVSKLPEIAWEKYKKYVSENPETISQIEATSRVVSYVIAGRFKESQVLSELVYLGSNLLVLLNDTILRQASNLVPKIKQNLSEERLKKLLTVLEYAEVFIEMAADKSFGDTGRWIFIVVIQITKSALRLLLLWKHNGGIKTSPPITPLDRDSVTTKPYKTSTAKEMKDFEEHLDGGSGSDTLTFTLKRSGRVIRRLSAAPPTSFRTWKLPKDSDTEEENEKKKNKNYPPTALSPQRVWAETVYITKPLIHLLSMYTFGTDSWKPWVLSSGLDICSLHMFGDTGDLNATEKYELKRRRFMLLFYILRSPFYDRHAKTKILMTLRILADNVPIIGIFIRPLIAYLPAWQKVYFYLWST